MRRMGIGLGVGINRSNYAQGIFNAYSARVVADGGVVESGTCVDAVSSLLQSASLLLIPSGYKGGKLYAEIPTNGNGDLTWTRGSDAFRTNASGVLQRVPWNLLQRSEEFTNAVWGKVNSSISADSTTAPNGTSTADKLVENTVNDQHRIDQTSTSQATQNTFSVYAKKAERDFVQLRLGGSGASFDLVNGTFGGVGSGVTASITDVGDGWFRCSITRITASNEIARINIGTSFALPSNYTGDGTSGIFIWGAQLVEGTTAQTYLPTTDRLNFPRLDYTYGSCPAVLLEPQRTNLCLQSETFDNASWTKVNATVSANTTTSPDGNTTADTFLANGVNTFHIIEQSFNITNGTNYAFSVYAKKNTNNFLQIIGGSSNFGLNAWANFDLNNGVVGSVGSSATASIVNVGNGWYRCVMVAQGTATLAGTSAFGIISSSTAGRGEINTLSTSVYLWGAQLEAGAYPTTYIPTTTATATRVADSFSRNNIYTNGLISASGGTWFVELRNNVSYQRDANNGMWLGDSTSPNSGNQIMIRNGTTSGLARLSIVKYISGASTFLYTTTTDTVKFAIKWNGSTADVFVNGTKEVSATAFTTTLMENLSGVGSSVPFFIQQMALFPTPLSDTDCATITTL